ncbi:MAG: PilZ domain-containing protein [Deltaproteobacteria bacterium]|nr:PilZ domain-containing protein [Deltaproteobacteria bacterium]
MDTILVKKSLRRMIRRAVPSECTAFGTKEYREIGTRVLDLSPQGMLIACNHRVKVGDSIMLFFQAPGIEQLWLDAEAEVTRVVQGFRRYDPGYCMGVRFTYLEKPDRTLLAGRLVGYPPPIPRRRLRVDYAESIRRIMQS